VAGARIVAALETIFNVLALNLALLVACVPVVTIPAALHAASAAVERWRGEGEDRLVREFVRVLRADLVGATVVVGAPVLAIGVGVEEVHFFALRSAMSARVCFGLGVGALAFTATALGYVLLLSARERSLPASELWSLAARFAFANLVITGPLFLIELVAAIYLLLIDPALCLAGIPALLILALVTTARLGVARVERRDEV
jgi:hypothetical protein